MCTFISVISEFSNVKKVCILISVSHNSFIVGYIVPNYILYTMAVLNFVQRIILPIIWLTMWVLMLACRDFMGVIAI